MFTATSKLIAGLTQHGNNVYFTTQMKRSAALFDFAVDHVSISGHQSGHLMIAQLLPIFFT